MTLYDILSAAAAYLNKTPDDFLINDVDLGLTALNQVKYNAELTNDFEFTRKLVTVSVDGVTGGSLDEAVELPTTTDCPKLRIKTIVDVGLFDVDGNFRPVEWTTTADSLNRQRVDSPYTFRYPTDGQATCGPMGQRRFTFTGRKLYHFPRTPNVVFNVGIEAYTFTPDWDDNSVDTYNSVWNNQGMQYLQWQTVVHMNQLWKGYVFRQEGNLPPPQDLADLGLASLVAWDRFSFEQFRRHTR